MNLTKIDRQILDSYASMIEGLSCISVPLLKSASTV